MHLPAALNSPPLTDEQFAELCAKHPDLRLEMSADGELIVKPATFSIPGLRNAEIGFQLKLWANADRRGLVSDSSTGFVLPNGARRSPDAAWTARQRLKQLPPEQLEGYWHLSPDFVIELRSPTDRIRSVRLKMEEWIENGTSLAWLLDPAERSVTIYRPAMEPLRLLDAGTVQAGEPVAGFSLRLPPVWDPLA